MATQQLQGLRVAIVVAEGFEEVEMTEPRRALLEAGATVSIVSPEPGSVLSFDHHTPSKKYDVDVVLDAAKPGDYDALLLPGGALNPDTLRTLPKAVAFVKAFFQAKKPVAAICHAAWTIIEAGEVKGRTLTSWPSLQTDIRNAGGTWVDHETNRDGNLVTSRKPDDIPAFNKAIVELYATAVPASRS